MTGGGRPPLDQAGMVLLAGMLGDRPETVISLHLLREGMARAWVLGDPAAPRAAVVDNLAFDLGEPVAFGADADDVWALLFGIRDWWCVNVGFAVADDLSRRIEAAVGNPVRREIDVYLTATKTPSAPTGRPVRLLDSNDAPLLARADPSFTPAGYRTWAVLLASGLAAGAVVGGDLVCLAHVSAASPHHANLSVLTLPAFRGRGFARAAAALVVEAVLRRGLVPVWSAGATNAGCSRWRGGWSSPESGGAPT